MYVLESRAALYGPEVDTRQSGSLGYWISFIAVICGNSEVAVITGRSFFFLLVYSLSVHRCLQSSDDVHAIGCASSVYIYIHMRKGYLLRSGDWLCYCEWIFFWGNDSVIYVFSLWFAAEETKKSIDCPQLPIDWSLRKYLIAMPSIIYLYASDSCIENKI